MVKNSIGASQTQVAAVRQIANVHLQKQLGALLEKNDSEIHDLVMNQIESNPALESKSNDDSDFPESKNHNDDEHESGEHDNGNDANDFLPDDFDDDNTPSTQYNANNHSADDNYYQSPAIADVSLNEYLMNQLNERGISELEETVAQYVIGNLDDRGYLCTSVNSIVSSMMNDLSLDEDIFEMEKVTREVIDMVRDLDPAGIGASDLQNCLLLQLERKHGEKNRRAYEIVSEHYDELIKKHFSSIAKSMGITLDETKEAIDQLQKLNWRPAAAFSSSTYDVSQASITPDFEVSDDDYSGKPRISLHNSVPDLQVSESYESVLNRAAKSKNEKAELSKINKYASEARNFIQLIKMRQETLMGTMAAIVQHQKEFFLTGDKCKIRPMTLKNISDQIGRDESVISRSTNNKFVGTPWGTFPLKYFFSEDLGNGVSARAVQCMIEEMIDNEDKKKPLSDDAISDTLKAGGYDVARRTVAKYREKLSIPVARLRKVE